MQQLNLYNCVWSYRDQPVTKPIVSNMLAYLCADVHTDPYKPLSISKNPAK